MGKLDIIVIKEKNEEIGELIEMVVESKAMDHIRKVLERFGNKYFTKSGTLKRNTVIEDLDNYDRDLMTAILNDDLLHKTYTSKIADVEIFEINKFVDMLRYKEYWEDSFTKYDNKIGLTAGGKYIDDSSDVVLDFPYKDCVLKAGMTEEDVENSGDADEPLLNEVLAKTEIDELFEPKIFAHAVKYNKKGKNTIESYSNDDNLIIKGNNLITLYSLAEKYANKIKLIYLDPPYNTGSDSFKYNDKFNHSTWLTFMKNRLEIAKKLLKDDGVIAVELNDSEGPYLKVLMDSIFGRENELFTQYVLVRYGNKTLKSDMDYHKQIEQIHYYKKSNVIKVIPNKDHQAYDYSKFCFQISTNGKPEKILNLGNKRVEVFDMSNTKILKTKGNKNGLKEIWASGTILNGNSSGRFFRDYLNGRYIKDGYKKVYKVYGIGDDGNEYRYFTGPQKVGATKGKYYQGVPLDVKKGKVRLSDKPVPGFIDLAGSFGNDRTEGGVELRDGKKPEELLKSIIKYFSNKDDIVLDFFAGSGTTGAVALKMNRKFILCEQISSQINKIQTRLNNVINGDKTGISREVDWQGGGSFIYTELMEKNQSYLKNVQNAENMDELMSIYSLMKENGDIDFRVDLNKFEISLKIGELSSLENSKKELIKIINKNQLYYNYSNIDDENVRSLVSDTDYKFNKSFYSDNNEKGD